jgi:hypothetical protein
MDGELMKIASLFLLAILAYLMLMAETFQQETPLLIVAQKTEYIGTGALRYDRKSPNHIIVGYEIENCTIEAPPEPNVVSYSTFLINNHSSQTAAIRMESK